MSALSLRLPDSLHAKVREFAERDGVSINQFVASAVAEKLAALATEEYIAKRAARGNREAFLGVLSKVRDQDPDVADKLP